MRSLTENLRMLAVALLVVVAAPFHTEAGSADLPDGSKLDLSTTCPICNMKLEASNFGPAAIVLKDGKVVGFDGAGDLFRYLLSPEKQTIKTADIKAIYVTEYGTRNFVDARTAYYVVGTNVTGDMGPEVVPFSKKEAAEQFKSEQNGKRVVAFLDVTLDDLKSGKKLLKMRHGH